MTNIIHLESIRLLSSEFFFNGTKFVSLMPQTQPLFVWVITFDLPGM